MIEITSVRTPSHFYIRLPFADRPLSQFHRVEEIPGIFLAHPRSDVGGKDSDDKVEDLEDLSPLRLKQYYRDNARAHRINVDLLRVGELVTSLFEI